MSHCLPLHPSPCLSIRLSVCLSLLPLLGRRICRHISLSHPPLFLSLSFSLSLPFSLLTYALLSLSGSVCLSSCLSNSVGHVFYAVNGGAALSRKIRQPESVGMTGSVTY